MTMDTRKQLPKALLKVAVTAVAAVLLDDPPANAVAAQQPNIVFIFGEGAGWTSTSVQMDDARPDSKSDLARTPNLERLAKEGIRFASFYAPSPRCTPSRAAILTGKSPAQLRMTFISEGKGEWDNPNAKMLPPHCSIELAETETTIAELLKTAGYATAHFGKWHVGRTSPSRHGFEEDDGANGNGGPENVNEPNPKQAFAITEKGIDFMERQAAAKKPFYLELGHYAGRSSESARKETYDAVLARGGGREDKLVGGAAVMEDMDATVGMLLQKIDALGIAKNTYVFYAPDHGSPGRNANAPLTGGKGTVWDGGLRVPFIMRGPGIQPGICSRVRATGVDIFPTLAELAHVTKPLPKAIEGGSLVPVLMNGGKGEVTRPREELVFHFPHYDHDNDGPASAILLGPLKSIRTYETGRLQLFDIAKDISEEHDLSKTMPEKLAELDRRLTAHLETIGAQMPAPNPNYDPSKPSTQERRGKGKKGDRGGGKGRKGERDRPPDAP